MPFASHAGGASARATIGATGCMMHAGHHVWLERRGTKQRGMPRQPPSQTAVSRTRLGVVGTPGLEPLPHGGRGPHLAAFQATQMALMEPELLGRLELGEAEGLAATLEACS